MVNPDLWAEDAAVRLLSALAELGWYAAWFLTFLVVIRLVRREYIAWHGTRGMPSDQARRARRAVRRVPVIRAPRAGDPDQLITPVVVEPFGDGRPGWGVLAPAPPSTPLVSPDPDGSRTDAVLRFGSRAHVLVVCLGEVGAPSTQADGSPWVIGTAEARAQQAHEATWPEHTPVGPVDVASTGMGTGYRYTVAWLRGGQMLTDTHVDHDGWAFVVGVLSRSQHAQAVEALDRMLATWRWLPARPAPLDTVPW